MLIYNISKNYILYLQYTIILNDGTKIKFYYLTLFSSCMSTEKKWREKHKIWKNYYALQSFGCIWNEINYTILTCSYNLVQMTSHQNDMNNEKLDTKAKHWKTVVSCENSLSIANLEIY